MNNILLAVTTFMDNNNINYSYIFSSINDGIAISCNKIINYARKKGYKNTSLL